MTLRDGERGWQRGGRVHDEMMVLWTHGGVKGLEEVNSEVLLSPLKSGASEELTAKASPTLTPPFPSGLPLIGTGRRRDFIQPGLSAPVRLLVSRGQVCTLQISSSGHFKAFTVPLQPRLHPPFFVLHPLGICPHTDLLDSPKRNLSTKKRKIWRGHHKLSETRGKLNNIIY